MSVSRRAAAASGLSLPFRAARAADSAARRGAEAKDGRPPLGALAAPRPLPLLESSCDASAQRIEGVPQIKAGRDAKPQWGQATKARPRTVDDLLLLLLNAGLLPPAARPSRRRPNGLSAIGLGAPILGATRRPWAPAASVCIAARVL